MSSLAHGDLGQSFYYQTPVLELYLQRLPNSLLLAVVAMALSLLIGIPSGILASVQVGRVLGQFRQAIHDARPVVAVLLGRASC